MQRHGGVCLKLSFLDLVSAAASRNGKVLADREDTLNESHVIQGGNNLVRRVKEPIRHILCDLSVRIVPKQEHQLGDPARAHG